MKRACLVLIAVLSFLPLVSCVESHDDARKGKDAPGPSAAAPSPPTGQSPASPDQALAVVGTERITRKTLEIEIADRKYLAYRERSSEEAYRRALENLMALRLLYLGALEEGFMRGTALEREIEVTKRIWLAGIYISEKLPGEIKITDQEMGDDVPAKWDASDISMVVFSSGEEARDTGAKIASGALTFEQAAARSIMPTRRPEGRVGEILRNTSYFPDKKQRDMIFALPEGKETAPFEGPLGWTIVRMNKKRMLSQKEIDPLVKSVRDKILAAKVEVLKKEISKKSDVRLFPEKLQGAASDTTVAVLGKEKYSYRDFLTFRKVHEGQWIDPTASDPKRALGLFGDHLAWEEYARSKGADREPGIRERMTLFTVERVTEEVRNRLERKITITDKEAQEYFRKNPGRYKGEDQVTIKAIFLDDEKIAREVKERSENGEDFESLRRGFSTDKSKEDFGPITLKMVPGEFGVEIFSLRDGDVSRVLRAGDKFVVAKMVKYQKAEKVTFAKVKDRVIADLRQEKVAPTVYAHLEELKKKHSSVVNEEEFGRFLKEKEKVKGKDKFSGGPR